MNVRHRIIYRIRIFDIDPRLAVCRLLPQRLQGLRTIQRPQRNNGRMVRATGYINAISLLIW